jgi:hypothetical protein
MCSEIIRVSSLVLVAMSLSMEGVRWEQDSRDAAALARRNEFTSESKQLLAQHSHLSW